MFPSWNANGRGTYLHHCVCLVYLHTPLCVFGVPTYTPVCVFGVPTYTPMCVRQDLAEAMTGISLHAKQAQLDDFCDDVKKFANAVCVLTENSAQVSPTVCKP